MSFDDIPDLVEELPADFQVKPLHLATVLDTTEWEAKEEDGAEKQSYKAGIEETSLSGESNSNDVARVEKGSTGPAKIPVTIVTGYLGLGKLTLLEMIGRTSGKRLAIILNEYGDTAAIEKAVTIRDSDKGAVTEWLDLGNGCLCCTVKDSGVLAIENLVASARDRIDHILLETTGIADPAPIAAMFWLDDALASSVYIDGVVGVVDVANIERCLDDKGGHWHRANGHITEATEAASNTETGENTESSDQAVALNSASREARLLDEGLTTAHLQLAVADVILLNKIDLLKKAGDDDSYNEAVSRVTSRIRKINASSPIHPTSFGDIALEKILDLHAFEASSEKMFASLNGATDLVYHDERITTVAILFPFFSDPSQFSRAEAFLQKVLWESSVCGREIEVHRLKGILVCGDDVRVVQAVRDTYEIIENGVLLPEITENKLVFIGKDLVRADLESELAGFLLA